MQTQKPIVESKLRSPALTEVQRLLAQESAGEVVRSVGASLANRVRVLESQAPELTQRAATNGVEIEYLGIHPLPAGYVFNDSSGTGWVLGPAITKKDAIMPAREAKVVEQALAEADLYFPQIWIAHETGRPAGLIGSASSGAELDPAEATELIGPIPAPARSVALAEQMAERSRQVVAGLQRAGKLAVGAAVGAVMVPVVAAGAVLSAPAMVDPIVLGVVPAASERPGEPAAWFALVRWDW